MPKYSSSSSTNNNFLYHKKISSSTEKAIIFLHGLGGTHRFWSTDYYQLSKNYSLYFLDLLGFGNSSKPSGIYTLDRHIQAVDTFIMNNVAEKEYILIGHSLGAIISLAYTKLYPDKVVKSFLLGLPYYHSEKEAHAIIQRATRYPQWFYTKTLPSQFIYILAQRLALPIETCVLPFFFPTLSPVAFHDMFVHSYTALVSTLHQIILQQNVPQLLTDYVKRKVFFIHGSADLLAPIQNIQELTQSYHVPLYRFPGDHGFPFVESRATAQLLQNYIF